MPVDIQRPTSDHRKKCRLCNEPFAVTERTDYGVVLEHYRTQHYDSEILHDVLADHRMWTTCDECGREFAGEVNAGPQSFGVPMYCPECVAEDRIRGLFATKVSGRDIVRDEVCEDDDC